jgi:hypothetical protein
MQRKIIIIIVAIFGFFILLSVTFGSQKGVGVSGYVPLTEQNRALLEKNLKPPDQSLNKFQLFFENLLNIQPETKPVNEQGNLYIQNDKWPSLLAMIAVLFGFTIILTLILKIVDKFIIARIRWRHLAHKGK